jgi:hypothetical protein
MIFMWIRILNINERTIRTETEKNVQLFLHIPFYTITVIKQYYHMIFKFNLWII